MRIFVKVATSAPSSVPVKVYRESGLLNKKGVQVPVPENEDKCTQCQLCAMMCPDQAIRVDEKVDEKDEN